MMKVKARKLLSLLLTIAMVAGMITIPASAEVTEEGGVFTLDFTAETDNLGFQEGTNELTLTETKAAGTAKVGADRTKYFTIGLNVKVTKGAEKATFGNDANYQPTTYANMGANIGNSNVKNDESCITFTTINAKAKIKVWWGRNGVKKGIGVFSGESKDSTTSLYAEPKLASSATATYITEITAPTAGHVYAVGAAGDAASVRIYKVEVTDLPADPNAVDITMGQTKASVLEGGTITLSAEKAPANATLAWTSGNTGIATVEENEDDTCTVTGVSAGTATITATVSKDGQDPISGECEVTVYGTKGGVLHFLSTDSNLTVPTTTDERIAVGKNNSVSGYAFELYGGPSVGTESGKTGNYKGTTLKHVIKLTGSSKGFSFMAPDAGTLTLYFADAEKGATVKYAEDNGELTNSTAVSSTQPFTLATKAGSTYKVEKGDNRCWATHFIWKASDYECKHTWGETAVAVDGKNVYYCTNPVCLETKAAKEPKAMTVTAENVSAVYDGQAHGITVTAKDGTTPIDATVKYCDTENGTYSATAIKATNVGTKTVYYEVTAEGYNTVKGSATITITQATPTVTAEIEGNDSVQSATASDRVATVAVTVPSYVADSDVTVKAVDAADAEIAGVTLTKGSGNKWKTNELPDETKAYFFKATVAGTANYKTSSGKTRQFSITNSAETLNYYKLNYDTKTVTIRGNKPDPNDSTKFEDKSAVFATAKAPAGEVFDHWEAEGKTLDETQKKTATDMKFIMPPNDMTLTAKFKAKTTEPTKPVTKTALYELLRSAEAYAEVPVEATTAAAVDKGEKWVTAEDKATFTAAIKVAQAVSSNPKATQAEVNKAVEDLGKAWDAFTATFKDGTKSQGGEPTVTTSDASLVVGDFKFTATGSETKQALTDAEMTSAEHAGGYFGVVGTVNKRGKAETGETVTSFDIAKGATNGFTITLKPGQTAMMTAKLNSSSTDATKLVVPEMTKDGTEVAYDGEKITTLPLANADAKEVIWKDLTAGTYTLIGVSATDKTGTDMRVKEITLAITTTTGGGDEPVVPDTAARTALKNAIADAKKNMDSVKTSTDGSEYSKDEQWVTERAKTAYGKAIELAEAKANSARFDDDALTAAKAALDAVTTEFNAAKRPGTKTGGDTPSGGGGGSSVPSSSGGTTVTNPDGSKTNTKTNKTTGAVTETTTWPNGDKTVVVTEKDGTKTETVTKKDGTKSETVTKPDGSVKATVTDAKGIKTETATSASGDTTAKVTLPNRVDKAVVTIPVKDATDGTVAVIVDAKGNETVIKTAVADETGLKLLVTGNVSVKIKDNAKKFQDIDDDYWAKGAVDFASSREIFKGTTEVTFSPMDLVDRGMMATVLFRLADAKAEGENSFFDVPADTWYTDAVVWANRSGVVTGYADGTFGPTDVVTREQMATMLFRYAKTVGMDATAKGDVSKFSDASNVSGWASEAMAWAVGVGLINGVGDPSQGTILAPAKTASRAEVATILQRMVKLMMQ